MESMLNQKDLAVARAALMFLDDEFFPDQEEMFQHYLDDQGILAGASTKDIGATRAKFNSAELFSAIKWKGRDELVSTSLTRLTSGDELAYQANSQQLASLIVTGTTG